MLFKKKDYSISWLVVFLGNPGSKYVLTRHNVGFMTADEIEKNKGVKISRLKFNSLTAICELGNEKVFLMKPQTYMNLSGTAVKQAANFYKIPLEHILVISDDVSLPVGKLRIRKSGSAGGHNGLSNIITTCGGDNFPRIKIGIGAPPNPDYGMADWVLGTFNNKDVDIIDIAVKTAVLAIEAVINEGIDNAMNIFNKN